MSGWMSRIILSMALSILASVAALPFSTVWRTNCWRGSRRRSSGVGTPKNTIVRSVNTMWVATMWNRSASNPDNNAWEYCSHYLHTLTIKSLSATSTLSTVQLDRRWRGAIDRCDSIFWPGHTLALTFSPQNLTNSSSFSTSLMPAGPNCCCSKGSVPELRARVPEYQKSKRWVRRVWQSAKP